MAKQQPQSPIKEVPGDPAEASEILERIEGIEQKLQTVEASMGRYKGAYKAAKETRDELVQEMREVAKIRLESNPLFDGDGKDE